MRNNLFYLLSIIIIHIQAKAQNFEQRVLLIPHVSVPMETYIIRCQNEGYQCTQDYFKQFLINEKSTIFEKFLETIDLSSEDYRENLFAKIKNILNEENIDLEQADLLVKIISKAETFDKNPRLHEVKTELKELIFDLRNLVEDKSEAESFFIFKKMISKKQFALIKYKIKYIRVLHITPYTWPTDAFSKISIPLIRGFCDSFEWAKELKNPGLPHYIALFNQECPLPVSLSSLPSNSSTSFQWKDYKNPILYTALATAALFFLNSYNMQIEY